METVSWQGWLEGLGDLSPTQRLVAGELARLADWSGSVIVSVQHLVEVTGRSRASVCRALADLRGRGCVVSEHRRSGSRQAANRLRLVRRPARAGALAPNVHRLALPDVPDGPVVERGDSQAFARMIRGARQEGWRGPSTQVLVRTVMVHGPVQLSTSVWRTQRVTGMGRQDALMDTLARGWEVLVRHAQAIEGASRPWAYWATLVAREEIGADFNAIPVEQVPEEAVHATDGEVRGLEGVGLDDFGPLLTRLVQALMDAGMDETRAWAGTTRVAHLAVASGTRRVADAGKDPRLADLGVPPAAARAWMKPFGSTARRKSPDLRTMNESELAAAARAIVDLMNEREAA